MHIILGRPSFQKNDILKQKRTAAAKSSEGQEAESEI
jgi:hypothetical protein